MNPFSSKYDAFLNGKASLSTEETLGLKLFNGTAMCAACHISEKGPNGEPPLFTDFSYDNLGIPKNPNNPFYKAPKSVNRAGANWVDLGLGGFLSGAKLPDDLDFLVGDFWETERGKQKVPTLRNVDKRPYPGFVKAFGHNGYFKSLEGIVSFYNTRDIKQTCPGDYSESQARASNCWPTPEVPENMNEDELGNLGLTANEEAAIVAFMRTLTDGYTKP